MCGVRCLWLTLYVLFVPLATGVRQDDGSHLDLDLDESLLRTDSGLDLDSYSPLLHDGPKRAHSLRHGVCGDGFCWCQLQSARCPGLIKHKNLTYIPKLPRNIKDLCFDNKLIVITRDDFFTNVTQITSFTAQLIGLALIHPRAFLPLKKLSYLDLSFNNLTFLTVTPVFLPTLEYLFLSFNNLGPPPSDIFMKFPMPRLKSLVLSHNRIRTLDLTVFTPLVNLSILKVFANGIYDMFLNHVIYIEILDLDYNVMRNFPKTCRHGRSFFPKLTTLSLQHNYLKSISETVCLPSLKTLLLFSNSFHTLFTDMFSPSRFPLLDFLGVSNQIHLRYIQKNAFKNPSLKTLYFGDMQFSILAESDYCSPDAFAGADNLTELHIMRTYMGKVSADRFFELFGKLSQLRTLNLFFTGIGHISSRMLQNFTALQRLYLDSNRITYLPDGVFDELRNLRLLSLQDNRISVVKETTFSVATRERLTHLDLSRNPFQCSCDLLWFQQWLRNNRVKTLVDRYLCDNLLSTTVEDFFIEPQSCLLSRTTNIVIIYTIVILISTFTAATLLFRFRWHIRLVLYEAFRGKGVRWRRLLEQHFDYDVFVSYDSDDFPWVRNHLMPQLEEGLGLRLCLHERDFTPGAPIVDNIDEAVQSSKKFMMVFSRSFARSPWCQFELQLCRNHVMEHGDALLVVLLEGIPPREWTSAMLAVMKTTTYIEWGHGAEAEASFWGRNLMALNELLPRA